MSTGTAHLAVYDGFADSEVGHLAVELNTGRSPPPASSW